MGTAKRLILPSEDEVQWAKIETVLGREVLSVAAIDGLLNEFSLNGRRCSFFSKVTSEKNDESVFDFDAFLKFGVPFIVGVALEMPALFADQSVPLLLEGERASVHLTRRQCACLISHSFLGSITKESTAHGSKKLWSFNISELFFLQSIPSAFCILNYFKILGQEFENTDNESFWKEIVSVERTGFPKSPGPPWRWEDNTKALVPVRFLTTDERIEESVQADAHVEFANRFVGGGCTTGDKHMEEILFLIKPELMVSRLLSTHMHDEEVIRISGALQFSTYTGFASSFRFEGDYQSKRSGHIPMVLAMDALQMNRVQFKCVRRDLDKARLAFDGVRSVATGNWGCGAFGNDYVLKFLQQWLAASDAGVSELTYHTFAHPKAKPLPTIAASFQTLNVGELWSRVCEASELASDVFPPPMQKLEFLKHIKANIELMKK